MKRMLFLCIGYFIMFLSSCQKPVINGDILIKNGVIYDGTGSNSYQAHIIIEADSIKWIGDVKTIEAICGEEMNAEGKVVTPGFIDLHAHGNPLETPDFKNFLAMGVTTIALGMDGSSEKVADMDTWIADVDSLEIGVNILPFIGHGTLRKESGIGNSQHVSQRQLDVMTTLLNVALEKGLWGLSMGLEYHPGYYADSIELTALAKVVGRYNAMITSHIRNEDNDAVEISLQEMFNLSEYCNVNISHLKVVYGQGKERAEEIMKLFGAPLNENYRITADLYPYTASYTGIGIVFPEWAKKPKAYGTIKKERRTELLSHLKKRVNNRNGPEATLFGSAPYKGKTLKGLEEEYNIPFEEVLADVIGPYGASAAFFVMDEELQKELVQHPSVMIASDGSPTMYHPRGHGTFAKVIEEFVLEEAAMNLATAIYKMSGLPAFALGLKDRGRIKKGMKADLLIFDPEAIKSKATFEDPHQYAEGMDKVLLGGKEVFSNQKITKRRGGVILMNR